MMAVKQMVIPAISSQMDEGPLKSAVIKLVEKHFAEIYSQTGMFDKLKAAWSTWNGDSSSILPLITKDKDTDILQHLLPKDTHPEATKAIQLIIDIANQSILSNWHHPGVRPEDKTPRWIIELFLKDNAAFLDPGKTSWEPIQEKINSRSYEITRQLASMVITDPLEPQIKKIQASYFIIMDSVAMLGTGFGFLKQVPDLLLPGPPLPTTIDHIPWFYRALLALVPSSTGINPTLFKLIGSNDNYLQKLLQDEKRSEMCTEIIKVTMPASKNWNARSDFLAQFNTPNTLIIREFYQWLFHLNIQLKDSHDTVFKFFLDQLDYTRGTKNYPTLASHLLEHVAPDTTLNLGEAISAWQGTITTNDALPSEINSKLAHYRDSVTSEASSFSSQVLHQEDHQVTFKFAQMLSGHSHAGLITALGIALRGVGLYWQNENYFNACIPDSPDNVSPYIDSASARRDCLDGKYTPILKARPELRRGLTAFYSKFSAFTTPPAETYPLDHAISLHAHTATQDPLFSRRIQQVAERYIALSKTPDQKISFEVSVDDAKVPLSLFEVVTMTALHGLFQTKPENDTYKIAPMVTLLTGNRPLQTTSSPAHKSWRHKFKTIRDNFDFTKKTTQTNMLYALYRSNESSAESPIKPVIYQYIIPITLTVTGLTIFTSTFIPLMLSGLQWSTLSIFMTSIATSALAIFMLGLFSYCHFQNSALKQSTEYIKSLVLSGSNISEKVKAHATEQYRDHQLRPPGG
ncbi:hypothetical protein N9C31_01435 [Gammaproteobacteria bacterium]|nr:hypothetical protein [Gammaproteobacteria bacterium]